MKRKKKGEVRRTSVVVDIEADGGAEWIKVSTVTEARILNEMAELAEKRWAETEGRGSDFGSGDGEGEKQDDDDKEGNGEKEMDEDVEDVDWDSYDSSSGASLLLLAEDLQRAAAAVTRTQYQRPRVQLVLPKLVPGRNGAVDALLARVRRTGTVVVCAPELARASGARARMPAQTQALAMEPAQLQRMAPDEFARFSPTLNIDCTILLALVSDLSHSPVALLEDGGGGGGGGGDGVGGGGGMGGGDNKGRGGGEGESEGDGSDAREGQPGPASLHVALRRQIERERTENLVPRVLWPAMAGRALVCTAAAARRMQEIVDTIGTATEKARTAIMMGGYHASPSLISSDNTDDAAVAAAFNREVGGGGGGEDVQMEDSSSDYCASDRRPPPPFPLLQSATATTATATATELFQQYSVHAVPASWKIPIAVVTDYDPAAAPSSSSRLLPPIAARVRERLSPLNQSVFLYGWEKGYTTLTSNRVAAKVIKDVILGRQRAESGDDSGGPGGGGTDFSHHGDGNVDVDVDIDADGDGAAGGGGVALRHDVVRDVGGAVSRRSSSSSGSSIDIIVEGDHRHNAVDDDDDHYAHDEDFGTRMALDTHAFPSSSPSSGPAPYPHIWLCLSARSLLGKEKSRR